MGASAEDDCVAIVFASSHQRQNVVEAVRDTKFCSDTGAYAFASVGDLMTGIAFVSMLSNESWLASAIRASRTSVAVACAPASRRTRPTTNSRASLSSKKDDSEIVCPVVTERQLVLPQL